MTTAETKKSLIWTDIDYEKEGKQVGYLHLPHSVTRSAYGTIAIPIAVIRNGDGPTFLLMAGNHGDEYEGQIVATRLIRELQPKDIKGRVIILPAANLPAAMDGARVSPIDGGNLNRAFPGDAEGSPTFAISHYIDTVLYTKADYHHDLHSGGSSLDYMAFCSARLGADEAQNAKAIEALQVFGAPLSFVWAHSPDNRLAASAAIRRGVVALGGEFGGCGRVSVPNLKIVERGVRNYMAHAGVLKGWTIQRNPTRMVELKGRDYYVYAPEPGLFEPFCELGDMVKAGQPCGQVHFVDNPAREPIVTHFRRDGLLVCKRHQGRVERGDCVAHLATDR
ncbi:MAG: succinylglutamate desuccinylase/aspartoacylase family protein [Alphaproteobacteria bacterium]|nr:succinylglutamate desuccinylase/aspartoacylase family protein [Alphaproteobacteria bacterium]